MHASPSALRAHALHLEAVTKNVRSHGGHGWTYDEEIKELNTAAADIERYRRALDQIGFHLAGHTDHKHISSRVIAVLKDGETLDALPIQAHHVI